MGSGGIVEDLGSEKLKVIELLIFIHSSGYAKTNKEELKFKENLSHQIEHSDLCKFFLWKDEDIYSLFQFDNNSRKHKVEIVVLIYERYMV